MPASTPVTTADATPTLTLSETDRSRLQTVVHRGHTAARTRTRAHVLLKLGEGWSVAVIGQAFDVCRNTVVRVRTRFQDGGLDAVLQDRQQRAACRAHRRAASPPDRHYLQSRARGPRPLDAADAGGPSGRAGLCRAHRLGTIRNLLKKTSSNPGNTSTGACPA